MARAGVVLYARAGCGHATAAAVSTAEFSERGQIKTKINRPHRADAIADEIYRYHGCLEFRFQ